MANKECAKNPEPINAYGRAAYRHITTQQMTCTLAANKGAGVARGVKIIHVLKTYTK